MSDIINAENFTNSYLKVPTSQGYINFDEFRQKVEAVSDQNQKQQYILQRPTYVSPAKIARERNALNKINHAVEGEDKRLTDGQISQDLSELLEDIYSEYWFRRKLKGLQILGLLYLP